MYVTIKKNNAIREIKMQSDHHQTGRTGKTTALYSMMLCVSLTVRVLNKLDCEVQVSTIKLMVKNLFYLLVDIPLSSRLKFMLCYSAQGWKTL